MIEREEITEDLQEEVRLLKVRVKFLENMIMEIIKEGGGLVHILTGWIDDFTGSVESMRTKKPLPIGALN